jgi:hypothetical protein
MIDGSIAMYKLSSDFIDGCISSEIMVTTYKNIDFTTQNLK